MGLQKLDLADQTIDDSKCTEVTEAYHDGTMLTLRRNMDQCEMYKEGAKMELCIGLSYLGNALSSDVVQGKTFTSTSGVKIVGTAAGSELPPGTVVIESGQPWENIGAPGTMQMGSFYIQSEPLLVPLLLKEGAVFKIFFPASMLGNAQASDVLQNKTFSSQSGINLSGMGGNSGGWN